MATVAVRPELVDRDCLLPLAPKYSVSWNASGPLSASWTRLERLAEVLRLPHDLATLEFHDAHNMDRLSVIGENEFAHPETVTP